MMLKTPAPPAAAAAEKPPAAATPSSPDLSAFLTQGLELCRRGKWKEGLPFLARIAESADRQGLPGLFYSYLGHGIALRQQRIQEGMRLCQHAIKVEFYEAENYVNLARTCMLGNYKRAAVRAVSDGLKVDAQNPELIELQRELGVRKSPVLPFFSRSNPFNLLLGRIRHLIRGG